MEYQVITARAESLYDSLRDAAWVLEKKVALALADGWSLQGSLSIENEDGVWNLAQAMVKSPELECPTAPPAGEQKEATCLQ